MTQESSQPVLAIAGFWRRLGAFAIDGLILGLAGMLLGAISFDGLARLGMYGRLLGFIIALGYFGLFNSRFGEGQTPGKKLLGVRVVDAHGQCLGVLRSLLRYAVLGIPFFLNSLPLALPQLLSWLGYGLALLVFGAGFSIIYLYVFNRRTRQSLHDLVVGSYVVRVAEQAVPQPVPELWVGHAVVVGLLVALSLLTPMLGQRLTQSGWVAGLMPVQQALAVQPHVRQAVVQKSWFTSRGQTSHYLIASLGLDAAMVDDEEYARDIARTMARHYPEVDTQDAVVVTLVYGFDLGIASSWRRHTYRYAPDELQ